MLRVRSYGSTEEQEAFFKKISVAKSYLIITDVHSKESKKQVFRLYLPVKLAYGRLLIIKVKNFTYLMYNIVSLGNHRWLGKQKLSIEKLVEYELLAK